MSTSSAPPDPQPALEADLPPQRPARGYYAIAHRAGNNLHDTAEALEARVDAIECDFWHARGRLALRHERKLPALPVVFDKWYIRFATGQLSLRTLLKEINFRAHLYLDIKSSTPRAADALLDLYRDHESMMPPAIVSSKQWRLLDRIAREDTDMRLFYSVNRAPHVDALLRRHAGGQRATGTSIRHTLLSPELIARLQDEGLLVYAWTVNTEHRAQELLDWGVDGLICDDLEMFKLRRGATSGSGAPPLP